MEWLARQALSPRRRDAYRSLTQKARAVARAFVRFKTLGRPDHFSG
jgi:hypothetical protein